MLYTLAACRRHGIRFSITVRQIKTVTAAIAAISEAAWTDIDYPEAGSPKSRASWRNCSTKAGSWS